MNWEAIGATGEWIGGLATIGTLFYLAHQIRQNTRTARSSAYQAAAAAITAWSIETSTDPVLTENIMTGMRDPDALREGARAQVGMQFQALFRNYENIFYQWREGAITDEVWGAGVGRSERFSGHRAANAGGRHGGCTVTRTFPLSRAIDAAVRWPAIDSPFAS